MLHLNTTGGSGGKGKVDLHNVWGALIQRITSNTQIVKTTNFISDRRERGVAVEVQ